MIACEIVSGYFLMSNEAYKRKQQMRFVGARLP
jgi:hypothetical protein